MAPCTNTIHGVVKYVAEYAYPKWRFYACQGYNLNRFDTKYDSESTIFSQRGTVNFPTKYFNPQKTT